jgi:hypothetical protein
MNKIYPIEPLKYPVSLITPEIYRYFVKTNVVHIQRGGMIHASDLNPGSVTFVGKREPGIW